MYKIIALMAPGSDRKPLGFLQEFLSPVKGHTRPADEAPRPDTERSKRIRLFREGGRPCPNFGNAIELTPAQKLNGNGINGSLMNVKNHPMRAGWVEKKFISTKWDSMVAAFNKTKKGKGVEILTTYFDTAHKRYQILSATHFPVAECVFSLTGDRNATISSPLYTQFLCDEENDALQTDVLGKMRALIPTDPTNENQKMFLDIMPRNVAFDEARNEWVLIDIFDHQTLYKPIEFLNDYFSNASEWSS